MKILVLNWRDIKHPRAGGAEVRLHKVYERFVEIGHEVTLLSSSFRGASSCENVNGIDVRRMGSDLTHVFKVWRTARELLKTGEYDFLVEDFNKLPYLSPLWNKKTKSLIQMHHLWGESIFEENSGFTAKLVWHSEQLLSKFYTEQEFIVVSDSTAKELSEMDIPKNQIKVVHNGSESSFEGEIPALQEREKSFLWLGRIQKYKGIIDALDAFCLFLKDNEAWVLKIAGSGPFRKAAELHAKKIGISESVQFLGFVSDGEKQSLMLNSHGLLQTSYKEGWGLTVIEAGLLGLPVLAQKAPGLVDSVKEGLNGLLYEMEEVEELADIMGKLSRNSDLWDRLSKGGRYWASKYSWERTFKETLEIIEEACHK
jgi:glycosyltransferase involved in cell wall biosynthesis